MFGQRTSLFGTQSGDQTLCGCWYAAPGRINHVERKYLPQVTLLSHTTILASTSRTVLTQTFVNPTTTNTTLDEVQYTFPLYDGVSVVGFKCTVASRTIVGVVKEKQQARIEYKAAIDRGETAGLLEQLPKSADVFTTRIGNVPANEQILVEIVYLGELKHDAETDGARFTIPTVIAPRYGHAALDSAGLPQNSSYANDKAGIRIIVDVAVEAGSAIQGLQSPSHPIAISIGRTSSTANNDSNSFANNLASATLTLGSTELEKDFIIIVLAKGQDTPRAMLEHHPSFTGHRALMATLVPRFNLPPIHPEIVFVVDRSGSMGGNISTLKSALRIFLKSLPVGVKFNICSFGSTHSFLWPKSKTYDQSSLQVALEEIKLFGANYGGTEMFLPIEETIKNRYKDMPLEVMVITDGQIWNQENLFNLIRKSATESVRFFSLGVGAGASSSLVEGIARAGDGFAQFVAENEKMDKKVVRMLKGALTPHIKDYTLEVKYEKEDEEFEMVESVTESLKGLATSGEDSQHKRAGSTRQAISLFDTAASEDGEINKPPVGRYDHLLAVTTPKLLQAPHKIPPLYPFNRTTVYLLLSAEACQHAPKTIVLRATSEHGVLELEIPVQDIGTGETIHQLAAKKAIHELENGNGWITEAKDNNGGSIKEKHEGRWDEIVEREAVRLGVRFQVGGKWCSFVAIESDSTGETNERNMGQEKRNTLPQQGQGQSFQQSQQISPASQYSGSSLFAQHHSAPSPPPVQARAGGAGTPFGCVSSTSSLFGSSSNATGGLFGNASTSSRSLFGVSSNAMQKPPATLTQAHQHASTQQTSPFASSAGAVASCCFGGFGPGPTSESSTQQGVQFGLVSGAGSGGLFGSSKPAFGSPVSQTTATAQNGSHATLGSNNPNTSTQQDTNFVLVTDVGSGGHFGQSANTSNLAYAPPMSVPVATSASNNHDTSASYARYSGSSMYSPQRYVTVEPTSDKADGRPQILVEAAPKLDTLEDRMHALIALQEFDGSWKWDELFFNVIGMSREEAELVFKDVLQPPATTSDSKDADATMLAVAWLQAKVSKESDVWEMLVEKATSWLGGQGIAGGNDSVEAIMAKLVATLKTKS